MLLAEKLCCKEEAAAKPECQEQDVEIDNKSGTLDGAPELVSRGIFWRILRDTAQMRWLDYSKGWTEKKTKEKTQLNLADLGNCVQQHWNDVTAQYP